jgi:glutamate racemase
LKLGFFDSGIGGLTVLDKARELMPSEEYIYYADTDNAPYGTRETADVYGLSKKAVEFLLDKGAEAVVIACNTATSAAAEELRKNFSIPIIGVEPAVKPAVAIRAGKRVLVLATPLTVKEKKLHDLIEKVDKDEAVDLLPMPELVDFAERGVFSSAGVEEYISRTLGKFYQDNKRDFDDYSVVVLGCTHFNHFIPMLKPFFDEGMSFIDGSLGTVKNLKHITEERGFSSSGEFSLTVYESGRNVSGTEREAFYREALEHLKGITD